MKRSLKILPGNNRRGVTMAGMMAMAVLMAAWCALILDHSAESYRAGAALEWRLQARAAAEGVAVLLAGDPAHPPAAQTLGAATVTCGAAAPAGRAMIVPLEVAVRPAGRAAVQYAVRYQARFERNGGGWRLLRVEE